MLLEVNALRHLVVGRPDNALADVALWARLSRFKTLVLVGADDEALWSDAMRELPRILIQRYDTSLTYAIQSNIRRALESLNAEPHSSAYVTFRASEELQEAINARIGTVQIGGAIGDVMPDVFMREFPGGLATSTSATTDLQLGYIAESLGVLGDGTPKCVSGQVISQPRFFASQPHLRDRDRLANVPLVVLGRYFPNADSRHDKHQLTRRLLKAKDLDSRALVLATPTYAALHLLGITKNVDFITRVPPKPSKHHDHLQWLLEEACRRAAINFPEDRPPLSERLRFDLLRCTYDYPPQHRSGNYESRADNVAGAFECNTRLDGRHIVLVDDILTSGCTAAECSSCLLEAGAASVTVLAIARTQNVLSAQVLAPACDIAGCGGSIRPLFNSTPPHKMFWGCDAYWTKGCSGLCSWSQGLAASNRLNTRAPLPLDTDIDF